MGGAITFSVPVYLNYTVTFGDIDGYLSPESLEFIAVGGNTRMVEAVYQTEVVTVNVSSDSGTASGYEVTISRAADTGLPSGYTLLDYIESTGAQYIDTGFM